MWLRHFCDRGHRERDDTAAMRADGQMGEGRLLLVRRQGMFDECAELIRVWMLPGLEKFAHTLSDAVLSENGGLCEVCSNARRFNSTSRGSVPRASSAARLLRPPD